VSATLAADFDIVGTAADGQQALNETRRLDPDVIVLDVSMPVLDGFQTVRALRREGSQVPIVFLSTNDSDAYVEEAFACGGHGYVVKTRVVPDLASALDHVLAGRLFVPSLTSMLPLVETGSGHAMHLYGDERHLLYELAEFFDEALRRGDATCVIGEPGLGDGLEKGLRARGWSVGESPGHIRYQSFDTDEALAGFMRDGLPDAARLAEVVAELDQYRKAVAEGPVQRLTIFGNMAALLSARGNGQAAMMLERTWSALTRELPFFTVCGYSTECFHPTPHPDLFSTACAAHWAVGHAHGV